MRVRVLALDLAVMVSSFAGLTLFSALLPWISRDVVITRSDVWLVSALYAAGVFVSYLVGCVPAIASSPRRVVAFSIASVSASMALSASATNAIQLALLRFVQGFASMTVPVFSAQLSRSFGKATPLALGILFSGTFVGGAIGYVASSLATFIGWRGVYAIFALATALCGALWLHEAPVERARRVISLREARDLWRDPFTLLWGSSFFAAMWILFTAATLGSSASPAYSKLFGAAIQASMAAWSVIGGALAYMASRRGGSIHGIGRVQQACLALAALGALAAMGARSPGEVILAAVMLGAVQGASPAFWSLPGVAYSSSEAELAGFVLGALSNSAALVGPMTSAALALAAGIRALWVTLATVSMLGVVATSLAMRITPPVLLHGHRVRGVRR
ncbi:MAG: MFS transporter [Crenarchaeota archaeon]|nr:MFS transporter [Thermoproteota archaeon]